MTYFDVIFLKIQNIDRYTLAILVQSRKYSYFLVIITRYIWKKCKFSKYIQNLGMIFSEKEQVTAY